MLGCGTFSPAAIFTVTNTNTSGAGSLAQAITDANSTAGADTIDFNIGTGLQTITLGSAVEALPEVTEQVTIDATTQPGFAGTPLIDLNGNFKDANGLTFNAAGCTVKGMIFRNFGATSSPTVPGHGVVLAGSGGHKVELCWIGLDNTGVSQNRNRGSGVEITTANNTVGGDSTKRNVISGMTQTGRAGVNINGASATGNIVAGNYIGLNAAGTGRLTGDVSNNSGVRVTDAAGNTIGGTAAGAGNVISGSSIQNILITGVTSTGNQILGNYIGTNATGTAAPSGAVSSGHGIRIESPNNTVGSATASGRNIISATGAKGILITGTDADGNTVIGNYIGTDVTGSADLGNASTGVTMSAGASGNTIGGASAGEGNVLSGNGNVAGALASGVDVFDPTSTDNVIRGNYIGVNAAGNGALGNAQDGVEINDAPDTIIGGSTAGAGNVIGSNGNFGGVVKTGSGIGLSMDYTTGTIIQGNFIGTDSTGTVDLGNARSGIHNRVDTFTGQVASQTTIGGSSAGEGNTISFNDGNGITLQGGSALVIGNVFKQNGGLPIDLISGDSEGEETPVVSGTNMNRPTITTAEVGSLHVTGQISGMGGSATFKLAIYVNAALSPDAEGEILVGYIEVTTDGAGNATFDETFPYAAVAGSKATCYIYRADGTEYPSEFSPYVEITTESGGGGGSTNGNTSANNTNHSTAGDPVNTRNGEYYAIESVDISLGGPLPLYFARYYAASLRSDGEIASALGDNRLHNFDWKLTQDDATHVTVVTNRGRVVPFEKVGAKWTLTGRADIPFQLVESGGSFQFADPSSHQQFSFDANGHVTSIADGFGNTLTLSYGADGPAAVTDGLGRTLSFTYTSGKLTSVTDGTRTVSFTYSGDNLATSTDVQSRVTNYNYDGDGLLTGTQNPAGNTVFTQTFSDGKVTTQTTRSANTSFVYDDDSMTETDPVSAVLTHSYDAEGNLSGLTDPTGKTIALTADASGRRSSVTDRLGRKTTMEYHAASGKLAKLTRADGKSTSFTYNARVLNGFTFYDLTKVLQPDGTTRAYVYDARGNITQITDELGRKTKFVYNSRGQPTSIINPLGGAVTFTYDSSGRVSSVMDSDTQPISFAYDIFSRLTTVTHPGGANRSQTYTTSGKPDVLTDERGLTTNLDYDDNERLTGITDGNGEFAGIAYDTSDTPLSFVDRRGKTCSQTYNSRGLVDSTTNPATSTAQLNYDTRRRLTSVDDETGCQTAFDYDDEARLTALTDELNHTIAITRDALGLVKAVTDALGHTNSVERDARLRPVAQTDALGRQTKWTYDKAGDMIAAAKEGMGGVTCKRDLLGNITQVTAPDGGVWKYTYTKMGRLLTSTDPMKRTTTYSRDNRGRVSSVTYPDGVVVNIALDGASLISSLTGSEGTTIPYTYDNVERVLTTTGVILTRNEEGQITGSEQNGIQFTAAYNDNGRISSVSYSNLFTVNYSYDAANRLTGVNDTISGATVSFNYDAAGRLTGITRGNGINTTFTLDEANRLTRVQHGAFADLKYVLNAANEVTSVDYSAPLEPAVGAHSQTFKYDKAGQIVSTTTSTGVFPFGYDPRGRLVSTLEYGFEWDEFSRLTEIADEADTTNDRNYTYNGFGEVITRAVGAVASPAERTRYFYNHAIVGNPIVAERDDLANTFERFYIYSPGGILLYAIDATSSEESYYHADRNGNVLALTDGAGAVTDTYAYGVYGSSLSRTGTSAQPFRWLGAFGVRSDIIGDPASETTASLRCHIRARWYHPNTSRFLTPDPAGAQLSDPRTLDPYQYAFGDPLTLVDTNGRSPGGPTVLHLIKNPTTNELSLVPVTIDPEKFRPENGKSIWECNRDYSRACDYAGYGHVEKFGQDEFTEVRVENAHVPPIGEVPFDPLTNLIDDSQAFELSKVGRLIGMMDNEDIPLIERKLNLAEQGLLSRGVSPRHFQEQRAEMRRLREEAERKKNTFTNAVNLIGEIVSPTNVITNPTNDPPPPDPSFLELDSSFDSITFSSRLHL